MHRIDTPDAVASKYSDGDPAVPRLATYPDAAAMNALQEELANAIEGAGVTLVKGTNNQLLRAIRRLMTSTPRARPFYYGQL